MCIVDRIRQLAKAKGYSLTTLEKKLGIGNGTIGKWKIQSPSCDKIILIADYLQTSTDYILTGNKSFNSLSADEIELIDYFKIIDEKSRGRILGKVETLAELAVESKKIPAKAEVKSKKAPAPIIEQECDTCELDFLDFPASAGDGTNADCVMGKKTKVIRNPLSEKADYLIEVSGDSMEPSYHNGDVVYIKKQADIDAGEVGLFILNGDYFIKKKSKEGFVPLNPEYPPIRIKEHDSYYFCGKVLGKAEILK